MNIASRLGIDESLAEKAVGIIMSLIRDNAEEDKVSQLFDQLPGAADLAERFSGETQEGGGLIGALGNMMGGGMGSALGALGALKDAGLDMDQIKEVGGEVFSYAKEKADSELADDVIRQVASQIPGLDKFI